MALAADKILHLKGGLAAALGLLAVVALAVYVSPSAGVAAGSVLVAAGVELYQKLRREGTPEWKDALASALPGLVLSAALLAAGM